jgi:hypothetical protein
MNSATHLESNIPILTEIISIEIDQGENAPPMQTSAKTTLSPNLSPASGREEQNEPLRDFRVNETEIITIGQKEVSQLVQASLIHEPSFEELEKTIQENVLRQLLTRVDFVLEHRVRDGLAEVLQTATDDLAKEIRQGLSTSLQELIHRTISQEISKIQSSKK